MISILELQTLETTQLIDTHPPTPLSTEAVEQPVGGQRERAEPCGATLPRDDKDGLPEAADAERFRPGNGGAERVHMAGYDDRMAHRTVSYCIRNEASHIRCSWPWLDGDEQHPPQAQRAGDGYVANYRTDALGGQRPYRSPYGSLDSASPDGNAEQVQKPP